MPKEEFLKDCLEFLDHWNIDHKKKVMYLTSGGNSVIMKASKPIFEKFVGYSINSITEFVAKELGKKLKYKE